MLYLLNTPILTSYGYYQFSGPISIDDIKEKLKDGFESAIGHSSTAEVLSQLLEQTITANRQTIKMQKGDLAVVFRLLNRVPEGAILSKEELSILPFEFSLIEKVN